MKIDLNDTNALRVEFEGAQLGFNELHDTMQTYLDGYTHSFYYASRPNVTQTTRVGVNLIQLFADKLWDHVSEFPKISVPSTADDKENAEARERILMSEHQKNNTEALWGDLTFDGSVMSTAVMEVMFDVKKRCNKLRRLDPRHCYWQRSDSNNEEISIFWHAVPMSKSAIIMKYGVTPKGGEGITYNTMSTGEVQIDNEDYFLVITRHDAERTVMWVGDQFIKKPFKHLQGVMPVEIAMPVKIANFNMQPFFWLSKLKDLQAEFNENWRRRANIVRKLGNPVVWGRGIYKHNEQDIKQTLASDGGFVPLKENGELNLLTIPETKMIDNTLNDIFQKMKDQAGFPTATFGESVGANTSGDALGMYFTPTQKMINKHNKAWKSFLQGINARILRNYEQFSLIDEEFSFTGYIPHSAIRSTASGNTYSQKGSAYSAKFKVDVIAGNYTNIVTPPSVTPKDDIAYKRFLLESVAQKFLSRTTAYDELGLLSPENELKLLEGEQQSPFLNPEGTKNVMEYGAGQMVDTEQPSAPLTEPIGV